MASELTLGLKVTVVGMTIVFVALYVLQLVMLAMRLLFYRGERQEVAAVVNNKSQNTDHKTAAEASETVPAAQGVSRSMLAAISAAIHACLGGKSVNIVAIRREQPSAWQQAARAIATMRKKD